MFSNTSDRSGLKKGKDALRLKKRQESADRQSSAREEVVEDLRATAEESPDPELWIDDHFQRVLKNLIRSLVDAENQLYGLQDRRERLESNRRDGKVPSGLKIRSITAKGKNAENLQQKFTEVLKEAELKLLDATIEALQIEEQQITQRCTEEKQKVLTAIENWRSSFKASDPSLDIEADQFVISAKSFADDFYFECAAERTSKRVAEDIKKTAKAAKKTERMETEFAVNEQSIQDMVQRAVRQELRKQKPVSSPPTKETSASRKSSKSRRSDRSNSRGRKNDRSNSRGRKNDKSSSRNRTLSQGRNRRNSTSPGDSTQNQRSRSKQRRQRKPRRVSFSGNQSPGRQSKNVRGRGNGVVK